MKNLSFTVVTIFYFNSIALSQNYSIKEIVAEAGITKIVLEGNRFPVKEKFHFNRIQVFDYRFDSTKLGYIQKSNPSKYVFNKIVSLTTWPSLFNNYFEANIDTTSTNKLLLFIRSMWISQTTEPNSTYKGTDLEKYYFTKDFPFMATLGIDIFLQTKSGISPFIKIEEKLLIPKTSKKNQLNSTLDFILDSIGKIILARQVDFKNNKIINDTVLFSFYNRRTSYPITTSPTLVKGIYRTLEDFQNNRV